MVRIIALTGPSGIGKTTISRLLAAAVPDSVEIPPILTTRAPKRHDDGEYRYVSAERFRELEQGGALVARTRLPPRREMRWYGYHQEDLKAIRREGRVPVVITERHLLQGFVACYGRASVFSCGLLPPGRDKPAMLAALLARLRARGRDSEESIRARLDNAEGDLAFFTEHPGLFDVMLVNDDVDAAVSVLAARVRGMGLPVREKRSAANRNQ
uniref:Guanylate kinase n=1 Tax=Candidatus Kentrum sp. FM TaxID=2126340 RepID=A0A450TND7_9GAMM|nr:MAG: guanylate kinase [Candidatus Kentron sp. FM]VFJ69341.1 MAG: guanylate kinase [Candidatus Kentron sp. FM]VFK17688.1 MAG: guanylate kinase [Candidatus Kentron sp. FM]